MPRAANNSFTMRNPSGKRKIKPDSAADDLSREPIAGLARGSGRRHLTQPPTPERQRKPARRANLTVSFRQLDKRLRLVGIDIDDDIDVTFRVGANVPNRAHLVDRFDDVGLSEVCYPLSGCFDPAKPTQAQVICGRLQRTKL